MGILDKLLGKHSTSPQPLVIFAPMDGEVIPVQEVNDPTFSEEILGKGVGIRPTGNQVVAPCDGVIEVMFSTGHAVSMTSTDQVDILIHVGLETVKLNGTHYQIHAANGDTVKKGQPLITFDRDAIAADGYDTVTPVVICNSTMFSAVEPHYGPVKAGDPLLTLTR